MSPQPWRALAPTILTLLAAFALASCGGSTPTAAPTAAAAAEAPTAGPNGLGDFGAAEMPMPAAEPTAAPAATAPPNAAGGTGGAAPAEGGAPAPAPASDPNRKIIKDATMILEVAKVDLALSQFSSIAAQAGGYILETRSDLAQESQKQAFVRMAVPVDQFETTLQRLREGASRIMSEQASGVDATQEFVDVQSQLANLEATQARIRQFLEQAANTEEALQVNAQLTEIEGQISTLKGRLQYLSQRAAYSTIAVQLQEPPLPTPTFSPTPTATATPTREPIWNPAKTTEQATDTLLTIAQLIGTLLIWLAIVVLPLALPIVLVALLVRLFRRRGPPSPPRADAS